MKTSGFFVESGDKVYGSEITLAFRNPKAIFHLALYADQMALGFGSFTSERFTHGSPGRDPGELIVKGNRW